MTMDKYILATDCVKHVKLRPREREEADATLANWLVLNERLMDTDISRTSLLYTIKLLKREMEDKRRGHILERLHRRISAVRKRLERDAINAA